MRRSGLLMLAFGISFLGVWVPAYAHHSIAAEYDTSKQLTLVGKLTRVELTNPHGWLYIEAKDSQGNIENWALELPGPQVLRRSGFDPGIYETLKTSGEVVTVAAAPAKDGSKHALGSSLTRADGRTVIPLRGRVFARGQGQGAQL